MAALLEFLNQILPPDGDGYRCWVAIKDKVVKQGFCKTNEELSQVLLGIDSRQWNAYFACSTYKEPTKRTQENVKSAKALWLDVDAGPGKPYSNFEEAKNALLTFTQAAKLSTPLIVCSGYGVHAYWPMEHAVGYDQWKAHATELKKACVTFAFSADPSRTSDGSSILRPPGTLNWKKPETPAEVYVDQEIVEYIPADISKIQQIDFGEMPKGRPDMTQGYGDGERTNELTRRAGYLLGPARNTEEEAIQGCLEWNKFNTPPLDEEKIVKTVQSIAKREFTAKPPVAEAPPGVPNDLFGTPSKDPRPPLPNGFKWGSRMEIMARIPDPDSEPGEQKFIDIEVCHNPFYVAALRANETLGVAGEQSVKIMRRTAHEPWQSFVVKMVDLEGPGWRASLSKFGVRCNQGMEKHFKRCLDRMIQGREDMGKYDICYNSFGWKQDRTAFVAGRFMYAKGATTEISGNTELEKAADKIKPNAKGSFKEWRKTANKLFAPGCEAQAFAMLASFAAPLMDMLFAADEGGSILSLVSSKTGQGKTVALAAIETVWGDTTCLRLTDTESLAAKFRAIGVRKNMPVVMDEYAAEDIDVFCTFVKMFTGGLDKKRLTMNGEDIREQLNWKTVFIGTTNAPVVDKLVSANFGAQAVRIFEVPVAIPEHLSKTQTSEINKDFERNSGFAGPCFLRYLLETQDLAKLEVKINALAKQFGEMLKLGTEYRFKTRLVAACAVVAQLLTTPNIADGEPMLEFNPVRIINWALSVIKDSTNQYSGQRSNEEHLNDFIRDNMQNFLVVSGAFNPNIPTQLINRPKQKLMGRYEKQGQKLYVPNDIMHRFSTSVRVPYHEFSNYLIKIGMVKNRNRMTLLSAGVDEMTPTRSSCWEIDLAHDGIAPDIEAKVNMIEANKVNEALKTKRR